MDDRLRIPRRVTAHGTGTDVTRLRSALAQRAARGHARPGPAIQAYLDRAGSTGDAQGLRPPVVKGKTRG